jgi:hypothetical protein
MSKKDFEKFAEAIRFAPVSQSARLVMAKEIAQVLKGSNPRFDTDRFIAAATKEVKGLFNPTDSLSATVDSALAATTYAGSDSEKLSQARNDLFAIQDAVKNIR